MSTRGCAAALAAGFTTLALCCAGDAAEGRPEREKRAFDEAKFERPEPWVLKQRAARGGPAGTEWDNPYRSMIQTSQKAESKGFPSHDEAVKLIVADARKSAENLDKHLYWTLFIKHFSSRYRPDEGTAALRKLYTALVDVKYGREVDLGDGEAPFADRKDLTVYRDVAYGKIDPEQQNLDAYIVTGDGPSPVLIEIHGGGWRRGRKNSFSGYPAGLLDRLFDAGISVVSINYRLIPKHPFPACEHDAVRAVQFVRFKAKDWNVDPGRIGAMGGSAGAHLSVWVGLHDELARPDAPDPISTFSSRISCVVDISGPVDMLRFDPRAMTRQGTRGQDMAMIFPAKFGYDLARPLDRQDPEVLEAMKQCSPIHFVSADDPPVLVRHHAPKTIAGADHPPVPETINDPHSYWYGVLLADALQKAGVTVERHIGPDVGKDEANAARVAAFIIRHLGTK
ncbi:MAG: alpha/beta hydrolase fold domain-containing protein [Planctomycetota bacterium]|jgi:acetyl esterase/lipase